MAIKPSLNCCLDPHTEGIQDGENRTLSLDRCTSKESFQWAQLLHLPIHIKALGAFTWYVFFFSLTAIFRCSNYCLFFVVVVTKLLYILAPLLPLCSSSSQLPEGLLKTSGFPGGSDNKDSACSVGGLGSILNWEDPLEEGKANHSSILAWRIPMDRGAWWATAHGVAESDMTEWLSTHTSPQEVRKIEHNSQVLNYAFFS